MNYLALFKRLSKREQYMVIGAGSVAVCALLYTLVLDPLVSGWRKFDEAIRSKLVMLERDNHLLIQRETIEDRYARITKYLAKNKTDEELAADTLSYLETLARNNSCQVSNVKPAGTRSKGAYTELLIDITADGSMDQLSKFIFSVEHAADILLRVRRFSISAKSGQEGLLKATLIIAQIVVR